MYGLTLCVHHNPWVQTPIMTTHQPHATYNCRAADDKLIEIATNTFHKEKNNFVEDMSFSRTQRIRVRDCNLIFGNKRTCCGMAYDNGDVELSKPFIKIGSCMWDTVIHELAHIAAGIDHQHDDVWLKIYREMGGEGGECADLPDELLPAAKWTLKCKKCTWSLQKYRRVKKPKWGFFCRECEGPMVFKMN